VSEPLLSKYANKSKKAWYFPDTNEKICGKCSTKTGIENFFKHRQTQDGWHSWCKTCCKESSQRSKEKKYSTFEGRVSTMLNCCKVNARARGNECTITKEDLTEAWEKQEGVCAYTGWDMTLAAAKFNSVSVERIDSSIGYTPDNTILVCRDVNRMKSNFGGELFFEMCAAITSHLGDENGNLAVEFNKN
jgi:hypothetical protein